MTFRNKLEAFRTKAVPDEFGQELVNIFVNTEFGVAHNYENISELTGLLEKHTDHPINGLNLGLFKTFFRVLGKHIYEEALYGDLLETNTDYIDRAVERLIDHVKPYPTEQEPNLYFPILVANQALIDTNINLNDGSTSQEPHFNKAIKVQGKIFNYIIEEAIPNIGLLQTELLVSSDLAEKLRPWALYWQQQMFDLQRNMNSHSPV